MDLIDRNALIEIAEQQGYVDIDDILGVPTVEAAPVVHGRWNQMHYEGGILDGTNADKCTVCGFERVVEAERFKTAFPFRPNCAAKMDL